MAKKFQYKFKKPPKLIKKETALKRITLVNRKTSSRKYFIRKKRRKTKILTASALFIIFLTLGIYIVFFTKIFEIKHIEIVFINKKYLTSENEIKNTIYTLLNKKYLYVFPQNNLFLFNKNNLERSMEQDSRIDKVTLNKKWPPARLFIKIIETQPAAQLVIYGDGGEYYLNPIGQVIVPASKNEIYMGIDKSSGDDDRYLTTAEEGRNDDQDFATIINKHSDDSGDLTTSLGRRYNLPFATPDDSSKKDETPLFKTMVILDNTEKESNVLLPIFYDKTSTNLKDQKIVILFKNILNFINRLDKIEIYIPMIEITEEGSIYEIEMTTTQGWQIFTNSETNFNKQLSNLKLILKEKIQQMELLQYIDLRFEKKIFYKLK